MTPHFESDKSLKVDYLTVEEGAKRAMRLIGVSKRSLPVKSQFYTPQINLDKSGASSIISEEMKEQADNEEISSLHMD
jgi:hypothetical protein